MPIDLTVSKIVHQLSLSVYPEFWKHLPCTVTGLIKPMNRPQLSYKPYQRISFAQTFISFSFFTKGFHNSASRLALLKIFLRLRTRIYTVKMVLNKVIYKYYYS